jgi:RNA polymerase sigma-70 factor (ECF subfamily)
VPSAPTPAAGPRLARTRLAGRLADADLDRLWLRGDPDALAEAHRRYRSRLEAVAYRIVRNRADAEDVVQRVFLALPRAAYRGSASLWSYLYRAATNGSVNVLRARRRRETVRAEAFERELLAPRGGPGPEARVLEGEILAAVAKALLHVKPQHRRTLVLRIVHGLSNREIAEREDVPAATVGTWLRRGREELRRALGPTLRDLGGTWE